jgi:hypothetical protein
MIGMTGLNTLHGKFDLVSIPSDCEGQNAVYVNVHVLVDVDVDGSNSFRSM